MTCAAHCCAIDESFDRRVASLQLDRYRRRGAVPTTRKLLDAIRGAGVADATVLDVGGGIGVIAAELLEAGASRATVVDASAAYVAAARDEGERRQLGGRLELVHGDFVALAAQVADADVVTLDKVVCCYPDMHQLLDRSTGHALRLYGIVYPRDGWWMRVAVALHNAFRRLRGSAFRVYVFDNAAIGAAISGAGFVLRHRERGLAWVVALYERSTVRP